MLQNMHLVVFSLINNFLIGITADKTQAFGGSYLIIRKVFKGQKKCYPQADPKFVYAQ
jgi:hypothetical protein